MGNYPTTRFLYCRKVGATRESRIVQVLKALLPSSYQVSSHDVSANGTDIKILHSGKTLAKFEVMNEDFSSYADCERALRIRKNLRGVPYKGLICSHASLTKKAKKILKNIPILTIGFQSLPKEFHAFYSKINKVFKRKIANEKSLKLLKNSILSFLIKIGFPIPMYICNKKSTYSKSTVPLLLSSTMCDGGSPYFPLEAEEYRRPKKGRKRVYRYVDPKKSMKKVSFRKRMQRKKYQWMNYDCPDCKWYNICVYRDDYTRAYDEWEEEKNHDLEWKLKELRKFESTWHTLPKIDLIHWEYEHKLKLHEKKLKMVLSRERMWNDLIGRNVLQIFGNQKGEKKISFNEYVNF